MAMQIIVDLLHVLLLVMQERTFRCSWVVDTRIPWQTRKPTDGAAVAMTPITTDPKACQTNTEHPHFSLRFLCCGFQGADIGFFTSVSTVGVGSLPCLCNKFMGDEILSLCFQWVDLFGTNCQYYTQSGIESF